MVLISFYSTVWERDWRLSPISIVSRGGHGVDSRFLCGDQPKRRPVEFAVTARDPRDQPVADHAHRWHRDTRPLRFGKRQAHILQHEGQDKPGCVSLSGNLVAVNLVRASAEHGARHDVDERLRIQPALPDHGNDFPSISRAVALIILPSSLTRFAS